MNVVNSAFFRCDGGAMYGIVPRMQWARRDEPDDENCCRMALNVCVVRLEGRVVLMDAGAGELHTEFLSAYGFEPKRSLAELLSEAARVEREEVTDVVLTHLHFDHMGGLLCREEGGEIVATFPQAVHWISRVQWEHALSPNLLDEDSFLPADLQLLSSLVEIRLVDVPLRIVPGLEIDLYDGHTPGQIVVRFCEEGQWYFFVGDTIPTRAHVGLRWISAFDQEPLLALEAKRSILECAVACEAILIFPHEKQRVACRVVRSNGVFRAIAVAL